MKLFLDAYAVFPSLDETELVTVDALLPWEKETVEAALEEAVEENTPTGYRCALERVAGMAQLWERAGRPEAAARARGVMQALEKGITNPHVRREFQTLREQEPEA